MRSIELHLYGRWGAYCSTGHVAWFHRETIQPDGLEVKNACQSEWPHIRTGNSRLLDDRQSGTVTCLISSNCKHLTELTWLILEKKNKIQWKTACLKQCMRLEEGFKMAWSQNAGNCVCKAYRREMSNKGVWSSSSPWGKSDHRECSC